MQKNAIITMKNIRAFFQVKEKSELQKAETIAKKI